MAQERPRVPLRVKIAALPLLGGAAFLAACSGGSEAGQPSNTGTGTLDNSPSPARTIEPNPTSTLSPIGGDGKGGTPTPIETPKPTGSPTVTPTENPTATATAAATEAPSAKPTPKLETPQPVPTEEEISNAAMDGFEQEKGKITPEKVTNQDARDPQAMQTLLENCNTEKKPFTPLHAPREFPPTDPDYGSQVLGQCEKYGRFTKLLYQATGNPNFLTANQLMKIRHRATLEFFVRENPRMSLESYWKLVEVNYSLQ